MDGSDWTAIISQLKSAAPDALITSTAGGAPNVTLTKQLRAAGVDMPYGNLAVDEGTAKGMGADAAGIYLSASYITGIDSPENKEFLDDMAQQVRRRPQDAERPLGAAVRGGLLCTRPRSRFSMTAASSSPRAARAAATGTVPTSLLVPQVVDAPVRSPCSAPAASTTGAGLVAALAYGADGIAMGTRFLLTPRATCQRP